MSLRVDRAIVLRRMIEEEEDHQADSAIRIGNWRQELRGIEESLSPEEKHILDPPAPPAPAAQTETYPEQPQS